MLCTWFTHFTHPSINKKQWNSHSPVPMSGMLWALMLASIMRQTSCHVFGLRDRKYLNMAMCVPHVSFYCELEVYNFGQEYTQTLFWGTDINFYIESFVIIRFSCSNVNFLDGLKVPFDLAMAFSFVLPSRTSAIIYMELPPPFSSQNNFVR